MLHGMTVPSPITRDQERNPYFHFHSRRVELNPLAEGKRYAKLTREGRLTAEEISSYARDGGYGMGPMDGYSIREAYCKYAAWAIYTREWLNSISTLLQGKRVVEVGAGRGILQPLMRERGIDWLATDRTPPARHTDWEIYPYVMKRNWQRALKAKWGAEAVFMSWWPYENSDDCLIAQACVDRGIPLIVVGEGYWGCTGTKEFWGQDQDWKVHSMPEWFQELPSWYGIHDYTYVALPKKSEPRDFFPHW